MRASLINFRDLWIVRHRLEAGAYVRVAQGRVDIVLSTTQTTISCRYRDAAAARLCPEGRVGPSARPSRNLLTCRRRDRNLLADVRFISQLRM